mgnify:FL=1
MKLKLEELKTKGLNHFQFEESIKELADLEFELVEPVKVNFTIDLLGEEVYVKGVFSTKIKTTCVKCLNSYERNRTGEKESSYLDAKIHKKYLDSLEDDMESDENVYEELVNGEIDIDELVREHLILEVDPYEVCSEKCQGLSEMKDYEDDGIDPRWAQLLEMSKNK